MSVESSSIEFYSILRHTLTSTGIYTLLISIVLLRIQIYIDVTHFLIIVMDESITSLCIATLCINIISKC